MANEYLVNSADLTSVADVIRTKGETSEQLVFPSGFVTAIENMKGGADLNFEIVGGTTQPTNPKENTIWVNTSTAITGWVFSTEEPATPAGGMIWIKTGNLNPNTFNALKTNGLYLNPLSAKQYENGAWTGKTCLIYQGGFWGSLWDYGLFINGEQYENITGGWTSDNYTLSGFPHNNNTKGTVSDSNITVQAVSGSSADYGGVVGTTGLVNISGFRTLKAKGSVSNYKSQSRYCIGVHTSKTITKSPLAYATVTASGDFEVTLDLPEDVSNVYVFVMANTVTAITTGYTSTMTVTEITLE